MDKFTKEKKKKEEEEVKKITIACYQFDLVYFQGGVILCSAVKKDKCEIAAD